jgi:hypothetical protein
VEPTICPKVAEVGFVMMLFVLLLDSNPVGFAADSRKVQPCTAGGITHALVTRSRTPSGDGELLVLAGNASAGALAAAEWLTQPWHAKELVGRLRPSPGAGGPLARHFQIVLKVAFQQGIPLHTSYLFPHALQY